MTMTWEGRQLVSLIKNGTTTTYKYDVDGLRLEKTTGTTTTEYHYMGNTIFLNFLREKRNEKTN